MVFKVLADVVTPFVECLRDGAAEAACPQLLREAMDSCAMGARFGVATSSCMLRVVMKLVSFLRVVTLLAALVSTLPFVL